MKYSRPLDDLLGQKSKVKILRHLANTRLEMSGRQVAADIGMSPWACHRALQDLTDQGVLVMRNIGRAHLFRLNEESYVVILSLALEMCSRLLSSPWPSFANDTVGATASCARLLTQGA